MRRGLAVLLAALAASALLAAVSGGLLRAGIAWPVAVAPELASRAAIDHAALMICAFLGTVIGAERAVALRQAWAWVAPLASGAAGTLLLADLAGPARWLLVPAGLVFLGVNWVLWLRQTAPHTSLLLVSAVCWLVGNILFAGGLGRHAVQPWWWAFLMITIAAERLEMTRLMRRRPAAQPLLHAVLLLMVGASATTGNAPAAASIAFGVAMLLLALWLVQFDVARRTVHADGLARYMAICLLGGYAWLAAAALAWIATSLGVQAWDAALHALGLGFVFSMMLGHAPVILPAVLRIKVLFGPWFYAPLALLHLSLLLRLGAGWADTEWRRWGAGLNGVAIALFALTMAGSALAWRRRERLRAGP